MDYRVGSYYPRVLIVSRVEITEFNSQGASRGSWFRQWPREHLAQIFSSDARTISPYCGYVYHLGAAERRFGKLVHRLRIAAKGAVLSGGPGDRQERWLRRKILTGFAQLAGFLLVGSGVWELVCRPQLSESLLIWVRRFRPDIIYVHVTDVWIGQLAEMLRATLDIPMCLHVDDDWPTSYYWLPAMKRIVDRSFRTLISRSTIRLSNNEWMTREYRLRYNVDFAPLLMGDDSHRFTAATPNRQVPAGDLSILYCGGLHLDRWKPTLHLISAAESLRETGFAIHITLLCSDSSPLWVRGHLSRLPWVTLDSVPPHEAVPAILKGADLLFLTESFGRRYQRYVRLSISSKAHLYMMSGTPILVYGPEGAGVVEYAREFGWGLVVDRPNTAVLAQAIADLMTDDKLRAHVRSTAREIAAKNHSGPAVREMMRQALASAALRVNIR